MEPGTVDIDSERTGRGGDRSEPGVWDRGRRLPGARLLTAPTCCSLTGNPSTGHRATARTKTDPSLLKRELCSMGVRAGGLEVDLSPPDSHLAVLDAARTEARAA